MSDQIVEKYSEARARVQERLDELEIEIPRNAIPYVEEATRSTFSFSGAGRRHLTDRILERLALREVLAAHDAALERALDEERERLEYFERVEKPQLEAAERERQRKRENEEMVDRIRAAIYRVREGKHTREDVLLLRRRSSYSDIQFMPGYIDRLLCDRGLLTDIQDKK